MRLTPPLRQQRDRDAIRAGAGRRHDRRAGQRPHAGRRGREEPAVRRSRAGRDRARAAAEPGAEVGRASRAAAGADAGDASPASRSRVLGDALGSLAVERRPAGRGRRRRRLRVRPRRALDRRRRRAAQPGQAHAVRFAATEAAGPRALHAGGRHGGLRGRATDARRAMRVAARALAPAGARACCMRCTASLIVLLRFPCLDARGAHAPHRLVVARACCGCWASRCEVEGTPPPAPTLLVANHVSWLDILGDPRGVPAGALRLEGRRAGTGRCSAGWSRCGGTLFIERERKRDALRVVHQMAEALRAGDDGRGVSGRHDRRRPRRCCRFTPTCCRRRSSTGTPVQPVALRFADAGAALQRGGRVSRRRRRWCRACGGSPVRAACWSRVDGCCRRAHARMPIGAQLAQTLRDDIAAAALRAQRRARLTAPAPRQRLALVRRPPRRPWPPPRHRRGSSCVIGFRSASSS